MPQTDSKVPAVPFRILLCAGAAFTLLLPPLVIPTGSVSLDITSAVIAALVAMLLVEVTSLQVTHAMGPVLMTLDREDCFDPHTVTQEAVAGIHRSRVAA